MEAFMVLSDFVNPRVLLSSTFTLAVIVAPIFWPPMFSTGTFAFISISASLVQSETAFFAYLVLRALIKSAVVFRSSFVSLSVFSISFSFPTIWSDTLKDPAASARAAGHRTRAAAARRASADIFILFPIVFFIFRLH